MLLVPWIAACAHHPVLDPRLPLQEVADVPLPGGATRFDYVDLDPTRGVLVLAHMNDGTVLLTDLDGAVLAEVGGVPTARGVAVAPELGRVFVTSSPDQVVAIDLETFEVVGRYDAGRSPDGVAWDPDHQVIGVSDQGEGALSLLADAGSGAAPKVAIGDETGNVRYDAGRGWFWITAVRAGGDVLAAVDPTTAEVVRELDLPGCEGAHGLRLHPDGASAFVACERNDVVARVDLEGGHVDTAASGRGPDVLALDPGLGFLYLASESGELVVYALDRPGVVDLDHEEPGDSAHTVEVDPASHRVYLPLEDGGDGRPILRILRPR
jgi:DNA-binding beta-propeller fold protein YncE